MKTTVTILLAALCCNLYSQSTELKELIKMSSNELEDTMYIKDFIDLNMQSFEFNIINDGNVEFKALVSNQFAKKLWIIEFSYEGHELADVREIYDLIFDSLEQQVTILPARQCAGWFIVQDHQIPYALQLLQRYGNQLYLKDGW